MEVKDKSGNPVKIVRHNGIEERSHRWSRMHTRRRTGRSRTTKEMAKYGALLAVLSNLENEAYWFVQTKRGLLFSKNLLRYWNGLRVREMLFSSIGFQNSQNLTSK